MARMEILTKAFGLIAEKLLTCTVGAVKRQLGHLHHRRSNVENLRIQFKELGEARDRVQHAVDAARRNSEEIEPDVLSWLTNVDQINVEIRKFFEDEGQANMSCCNGWFPNFKSRYELGKRAYKWGLDVKDIKDKDMFDRVSYRSFAKGIGTAALCRGYEVFESRMATIRGVKEALTDPNINKIGVWGMGGVGKTMLVKEIARQVIEEEGLFDAVGISVVSQTPDSKRMQLDIGENLGLRFDEETVSRRADLLQERLRKEQKLLIIIDDIWGEIDLEALGISFGNNQKGCKLLLTSRFRDVLCVEMRTPIIFPVEVLWENEATYLFHKIVGELVENADFRPTAVEIVKECAGLPIAIKTLAHALKNKSLNVWKDAMNQLKRASPTNIRGLHKNVYSTIKLSYDFLESEEAKSLFLLSTIFGEDRDVYIMSLIRYGMGLGLFDNVYTFEDARVRVEALIENLIASCLLLEGPYYWAVRMHDITRDVAVHIAKDKHMFTGTMAVELEEWSKRQESTAISFPFQNFSELPERLECPKLQLFCLFHKSHIPLHISDTFFEVAIQLRVIDLTGKNLPKLPSSLSLLQNLQTLCLDDCVLKDIAIIGELKILKILSLIESSIEQLPKEIGQLTLLQSLDLRDCTKLQGIPSNLLSNLKSLQELFIGDSFNQWEVEGEGIERSNASISELDHLSHLIVLHIHIPNLNMLPETVSFTKLLRYTTCIGDDWNQLVSFKFFLKKLKLKLHQSFRLHDGIKTLLKSCTFLELAELKGVKHFRFEDCEGFPQLKHLHMLNNAELRHIISLMGLSCIAFPHLESFSLRYMTNLVNMWHGQLSVESFCNLRNVHVEGCDNLRFLFSSSLAKCFSQLEQMEIHECKLMSAIVAKERDGIEVTTDSTMDMMEFSRLRSLNLQNLPGLLGFYSNVDSHVLFNEKVSLKLYSVY